jgi:hypothetical protein
MSAKRPAPTAIVSLLRTAGIAARLSSLGSNAGLLSWKRKTEDYGLVYPWYLLRVPSHHLVYISL